MKTLKRILIGLSILTALIVITILLIPGTPISVTYKFDSKEMIERIANVKNKSELEAIFEENSKYANELNNLDISLKNLIGVTFDKKNLDEQAFQAIISFLEDPILQKKYKIRHGVLSFILLTIISNPSYTLSQKEHAVNSINIVPIALWKLEDYFLTPENQNTPLFQQYIKWCLSDNYLDFLFKVFDKLELAKQMEVIQKINPNKRYRRTKPIPFLKKIAESEQYDDKLRELAKQHLDSLEQDK